MCGNSILVIILIFLLIRRHSYIKKKATSWLLDFGGVRSTDFLACSSLRFFGLMWWIGVCAAALYAHFRGLQRIALLRPCGRWLVSVACFTPDIFLYGVKNTMAVQFENSGEFSKGRRVCRIAAGRRWEVRLRPQEENCRYAFLL